MKKSILFILTISTLFVFNGCEKDYDYRDKWVGKYRDTSHGINLIVEKVNDSLVYIYDERLTSIGVGAVSYQLCVDKKGNLSIPIGNDQFLSHFDGEFCKSDSLRFTYNEYGHYGESANYQTYRCKKIKE